MVNNDDNLIEKEVESSYLQIANEFKYPKGVVNTDDYNKYLYYNEKWKNHINRYYKTKKEKIEIDLALSCDKVKSIMSKLKLSKEENDYILDKNKEIYNIIQTSILYKRRAFGDNRVILTENGFIADEFSGVIPVIIDLAGRFYKIEEIHRTICEDLEITNITLNQIKNIIKDNLTKIKSLQEEYQKDYSDVRLAYKRSRLDELQQLYNIRKSIYEKGKSREDEKQLMVLLEAVKKEIQGDLVVNASVNLQIEENSNRYIEQEMLKNLNISMFVLARICGKLNINPTLILSRLANSRYAQFSGYSPTGLSSTANTDPIDYASNITYNWVAIKQKNEAYNEENKKLAALPIEKNNLKERLLQRLSKAKEPLEKSKNNLLEKNS